MGKRILSLIAVLSLVLFSLALGADKYVLDAAHSSASFSVKHMVISKTKGNFKDWDATFMIDEEDLTKSSVELTIKTASIDTDNEKRNGHLKSADFFDVETYPEITFKSTMIEKTDDGYLITGNLTIKDVTKEVSFPLELNGFIDDPMGNRRFGAEAGLTINRQDFNLKWNKTLDTGGLIVGNDVEITLQLEATKAKEGTN
ncbi:polyisoprenoid-binding protein [candidate division KSB1 bacterium]|nr:polyisoprenoid-binding protein [candidate division KSB1 bacterium]TDI85477.1 MAG: polyisoprenoid-binding protein [Caldithrix sp.]